MARLCLAATEADALGTHQQRAPFDRLGGLPAFFYVPSYAAMGLRVVPGFFLGILAGAVVLTWLYNSSGGSVVAVVLWHASFNFVTASPNAGGLVAAVTSSLVMVWAVAVVWRYGGATLMNATPAARSVRANRRERARALPGDELIPEPIGAQTHAVTIRRSPRDVWRWLAQMGAGSRAGWYSYDLIDNGGHRSAVRIVPELQDVAVGLVFPALPGETHGFVVVRCDPEHSLVLAWPSEDGKCLATWGFTLDETAPERTRLVVRARAGGPGLSLPRVARLDRPAVRAAGALHHAAQATARSRVARGTPAQKRLNEETVMRTIRSAVRWLLGGGALAAAGYATTVGITWVRYGRANPARGAEADPLLDRFIPSYEVVERHHVPVAAPAEITLQAAFDLDLKQSVIVRGIFKGRELIMGSQPADTTAGPRGLAAQAKAWGWGVLAEIPGREIVFGAVTQPWLADVVFRAVPPDEFAAFREPDYVKIVWSLRADPTGAEASIARTETRVATTDKAARAKFRRYWSFVSPGIWLIRRMSLGLLKTEAERRAREEREQRSELRETVK